ncbi:YciI family protein [Celerinatantimonas diazotrophica]|uniref:YCII-related domain-containing protein n=1 Tax=Celerinatantimonas diazotrophica TaxID=412034 RepID=A0A4R1J9Q3_9GAMM|nr:YciI family protein [Celerinatantimonas diazotrophica]TCK47345.1 hypothetical protein EV690_2363 [Celerinatantimonas diazotrophica]CAG9295039.1 hypothetical protein CEDIAZO_00145 [Celerinatantimonas diazotrophica]
MRVFVVTLSRKRKGELTDELLNKHVEHLRLKTQEGKIRLCGPFADGDSAMQVLTVSDKNEAIQIIEGDPFIRNDYYQDYQIQELIEANENNNWLMKNN